MNVRKRIYIWLITMIMTGCFAVPTLAISSTNELDFGAARGTTMVLPNNTYQCLNGTVYVSPNTYVGIGYPNAVNDVKTLQGFLSWQHTEHNTWGTDPGAIDGQFGTQTYSALFNFQNIVEGLTPDGIAGPATWGKINDIYRAYNSPTLQFYKS